MTRPATVLTICLRIVCAVALLSLGFAHHRLAPEKTGIPADELAQYILPDGSLPVFCLTARDGGAATEAKATKSECVACRIGAAMLLPEPTDGLGKRIAILASLVPGLQHGVVQDSFPGKIAEPRAPPARRPA